MAKCALALAFALLALTAASASPRPGKKPCTGTHWVAAWAADPADARGSYTDQSLRLLLTPTYGGRRIRVRLSNRLGTQPVRFSAATVARAGAGAGVVASSIRRLRFAGADAVTLAVGDDVWSDPIAFSITALQRLAVSVHVDGFSGSATEHLQAGQLSYVASPGAGDQTSAASGAAYTRTITTRPFVTGLAVIAPAATGTLVTLGDSITDGTNSTPGAAASYPEALARRLARSGAPTPDLAVANAGIAANRLDGDFPYGGGGPSAQHRLDADVIAEPGVTDVVVMEGTNDIGQADQPQAGAADVIADLEAIVARLHAAHLNVILATQTPSGYFRYGDHGSPAAVAKRRVINRWIRAQHVADGVADFDAALRAPRSPSRLRSIYNSGDNLHPNDAGYRAMARAVPLPLLRGPRC